MEREEKEDGKGEEQGTKCTQHPGSSPNCPTLHAITLSVHLHWVELQVLDGILHQLTCSLWITFVKLINEFLGLL